MTSAITVAMETCRVPGEQIRELDLGIRRGSPET
jgi:hypothetical protein